MALRKTHLGIDYEPLRGFIDGDPNDTRLPVDLDGIMERRGKFLAIEIKQPGERESRGQQIMLENLARVKEFTVIVVEVTGAKANTGATLCEAAKWKRVGIDKEFVPTTTTEVREFMKKWWEKASESKRS